MAYRATHPQEGLLRLAVLKARAVRNQRQGATVFTLGLPAHKISRLGKKPPLAREGDKHTPEVILTSQSSSEWGKSLSCR